MSETHAARETGAGVTRDRRWGRCACRRRCVTVGRELGVCSFSSGGVVESIDHDGVDGSLQRVGSVAWRSGVVCGAPPPTSRRDRDLVLGHAHTRVVTRVSVHGDGEIGSCPTAMNVDRGLLISIRTQAEPSRQKRSETAQRDSAVETAPRSPTFNASAADDGNSSRIAHRGAQDACGPAIENRAPTTEEAAGAALWELLLARQPAALHHLDDA